MTSHSDMSNLLAILAKCDKLESCISCCTNDSPATLSPPSWSSNCSLEVESGVVDTLYCQCVERLSCRSLFELGSFCPGCQSYYLILSLMRLLLSWLSLWLMLYNHIYLVGYGKFHINLFAPSKYKLVSIFMVDF
jgi:hypothetical protein